MLCGKHIEERCSDDNLLFDFKSRAQLRSPLIPKRLLGVILPAKIAKLLVFANEIEKNFRCITQSQKHRCIIAVKWRRLDFYNRPLRDLEDFDEVMEWFLTHDRECEAIAAAALQLAQTVFTAEYQQNYLRREIKRVALAPAGVPLPLLLGRGRSTQRTFARRNDSFPLQDLKFQTRRSPSSTHFLDQETVVGAAYRLVQSLDRPTYVTMKNGHSARSSREAV